MAVVALSYLLEAGVQFGHQTKRWNPKMKEYIYTAREDIYIIDLQKTQALIEEAYAEIKNIADNGGMGVTLDIMSRMKDANYEEYFINWAKVWCIKAKPEYQQLLLRVDVHAPAILRANMQPRNFSEWYDTFKVTSKDKMYLVPSKRVTIW